MKIFKREKLEITDKISVFDKHILSKFKKAEKAKRKLHKIYR